MPTFVDEVIEIPNDVSDAIPPVLNTDVEYPCDVCGKEAGPYGGRGRKPTKCSDHKKSTSKSSATPRVSGKNDELARQATEALCSINGMMALGATIVGMTMTAGVITEQDDIFRARVYTALLNSPDTARKIIKVGSKAGDSALLVAFGLHLATILPVFMMESKMKKAEREARKLETVE